MEAARTLYGGATAFVYLFAVYAEKNRRIAIAPIVFFVTAGRVFVQTAIFAVPTHANAMATELVTKTATARPTHAY